jgi:hypothetical protein
MAARGKQAARPILLLHPRLPPQSQRISAISREFRIILARYNWRQGDGERINVRCWHEADVATGEAQVRSCPKADI